MINFFKKYKFEILFFVVFLGIHLPSLGHDNFNTDVWKWKARSYDFGSGVFGWDFEKTIQKYHPGVTLMWVGTFSVKFFNLYFETAKGITPPDTVATIFALDQVQKILLVTVIGLVWAMVIYLTKILFNKRTALLVAVFVTLEPFFLALTRVFHLEGLQTTLMFGSILWLYFWIKNKDKHYGLILSGVFGGLAVLTKTSAVFLIPYVGLILLIESFNQKGSGKDFKLSFSFFKSIVATTSKPLFIWFGVLILSFVLFWPAMWTHAVLALQTLYRGVFTIGVDLEHEQFYFGKLVGDPGYFYYFVVWGLRSSIALFIGFIGFLYIYFKNKMWGKNLVTYLLLFILFYFIQITLPSKKLDRYILPITLASIFLAAFYYDYLSSYICTLLKKSKKAVVLAANFGVSFILFLYLLITAYVLHPDYLSYFNPVFGGLSKGIFILEPKWLIGEPEIIAKLTEIKLARNIQNFNDGENIEKVQGRSIAKQRFIVSLPEKYYTQLWPFIKEMGGWAVISKITPQARDARFWIYPVWEDTSSMEKDFKLGYLDSVYVRGVEVYRIYERTDF